MNTTHRIFTNKVSVVWASLSLLILTSIPSQAQIINGVEEIAEKTTVQINTDANPGGSGVIIKKEGNTYSVLTANHVVCANLGRQTVRCRTDYTYTIRTHDGIEYPIKERQILQTKLQDPDLAIVTFNSPEHYEVAELGNSDKIRIGSDIFVAGFPAIFGRVGIQRSFTVTDGKIVTFINNPPQGYGLVYNATTRIGNSGGPVFDISGSVIGIHGLADTDIVESDNPNQSETRNSIRPNPSIIRRLINPQAESGTASIQKTGFNAGIPINILYRILPQNEEFNTSTTDSSPSDIAIKPSQPQKSTTSKYRRLEKLLQYQNFEEADNETSKLIRDANGGNSLSKENAEKFSCGELRTIDRLWVKYSKGKYGFSVQQKIYQSLGGSKEAMEFGTSEYKQKIIDGLRSKTGWSSSERAGRLLPVRTDGVRWGSRMSSGSRGICGREWGFLSVLWVLAALLSRHAECNT
jgi:hypothetical protein